MLDIQLFMKVVKFSAYIFFFEKTVTVAGLPRKSSKRCENEQKSYFISDFESKSTTKIKLLFIKILLQILKAKFK